MKRFRIAALMTAIVCLSGCKKPDPNPELADPIFRDLEARATVHQKTSDESAIAVANLSKALLKAEPNSLELKDLKNQLAKAQINFRDASQWARYYKIRSARRKVEDKISYETAFASDKPWPPAGEFNDYQVNRRLVESNRNWNLRVPKPGGRLPSSKSDAKPKSEHGSAAAPAHH